MTHPSQWARGVFLGLMAVATLAAGSAGIAEQTTGVPEATHPIHVAGKLERVEGKSLVLKLRRPKDGQTEVAVVTDDATQFNVDDDPGTLADLQPGMGIAALDEAPAGDAGAGTDTKPTLVITAKSAGVSGTLLKRDGTTLTIKTFRAGDMTTVDVQTDEKTKVTILGRLPGDSPPPTLADLKPGMHVRAVPDTGVAKKIFAFSAP